MILVDTSVWIDVFRRVRPLDLYRSARRTGLTVRSSADCLIAVCALRHDLEVLHRDRDFAAIAKVAPLRHRAP